MSKARIKHHLTTFYVDIVLFFSRVSASSAERERGSEWSELDRGGRGWKRDTGLTERERENVMVHVLLLRHCSGYVIPPTLPLLRAPHMDPHMPLPSPTSTLPPLVSPLPLLMPPVCASSLIIPISAWIWY